MADPTVAELPKLKPFLTIDQAAKLQELQQQYDRSIDETIAVPPSCPKPGQLRKQREVDSETLLSLKLAEFSAGLALAQETGKVLRTQWNTRAMDITSKEYNEALELNDGKVNYFMARVYTLRNHRQQILGKIQDDSRLLRVELQDDWAYIDGILRAFRNPHNANNTQAQFRAVLIKNYEAKHAPNKPGSPLWCPISASFHEPCLLRAAHIVKKNVGENAAEALFGETTDPQGHIWQPRNGILIHSRYKRWWDSGVIAIVPAEDDDKELQVIVLEPSAFEREAAPAGIPYGDALHGIKLQFRGELRPARRFLWFKFAVTLLHRQRAEVPGSLFDRQGLPEKAKELWLSPGTYLTGSVLFKLARQLGFLSPSEAVEFWGMPRGTEFEEDEVSNTLAMNLQLSIDSDGEGGAKSHLRKKSGRFDVLQDDEDDEDNGDDLFLKE